MKVLSLKNCFLIAMPSLIDPNFSRSVIFIYEHSAQGATGIVINKALSINLGQVLKQLKIEMIDKDITTHPVLMGGPIKQEMGFVIFESSPEDPKAAHEINISTTQEMLKNIAQGKGPKDFLITLGYSGWQPGQLETELTRNDWLVAPYSNEILFHTPLNQRWEKAASLIGVNVTHLSDQVGHA